jgi:hypothetical protein
LLIFWIPILTGRAIQQAGWSTVFFGHGLVIYFLLFTCCCFICVIKTCDSNQVKILYVYMRNWGVLFVCAKGRNNRLPRTRVSYWEGSLWEFSVVMLRV